MNNRNIENHMVDNKEVVRIPNCKLCIGRTCYDCSYMSRTESNKYDEYWCGLHKKYYDPSDDVCRYFDER